MTRFILGLAALVAGLPVLAQEPDPDFHIYLCFGQSNMEAGAQGRAEWVEEMTRIAGPVLENLAQGTLKANMPFESLSKDPLRKEVSYLEAFGRTVCGIAPWLELGPDETSEGRLRAKYIDLTVKAFQQAVDPDGPDRLVFDNRHTQPLVDAAFLAEGVLRAPTQTWGRLDARTRRNLVDAWKTSRSIRPYESNWLLFASIIEAALLEFTGDCQLDRLYDGVTRFRYKWYKGDAWYGDGEDFHLDYYNSLVIHPMLTEVLQVLDKHGLPEADFLPEQLRRQATAPGSFDGNGWLRVGFAGSQHRMGEEYINTGSLYLCMAVFLPLGLPETDPFWSRPDADWTSRKAWNGIDVGADHAR